MTPIESYHQQCQQGIILADPQQLIAMQHLQRIYENVLIEAKRRVSWLAIMRKPISVQGLYLWGGVGVGKTFMMDCFYQSLPIKNKLRMHFHQFMQLVHQKLTVHQGEKNPLDAIADELARQSMLLCFDELFVSDITDAMLLGKLFKALFARGVCLVTTSNSAPDELYKNGLQREQFLPAIALLKEHTTVLHVPTHVDYRLRHLQEAGIFYSPLNHEAQQKMEKSFLLLTNNQAVNTNPIEICGRQIRVVKQAGEVVWFDFADLCSVPRSQVDYLAIAKMYRTVFVSNIPVIPPESKDTICLFISMVDVFYDAKVKLVMSAAEPVEQIYSRGYMILEYTRTHSRLLEMQSMDYFTS